MTPTKPIFMPKQLHRLCASTILMALSFHASDAQASNNEIQAATLARQAEKLLTRGEVDEACEKLATSVKLDLSGSTMLELARCREKQGRTASAYRAYESAADLAKKEKRNDRLFAARRKIQRLRFRLPRLQVIAPKAPPEGLALTIDGEPYDATHWNKARPADPGERTIVASAPGHRAWETKVTLRAGQQKRVAIPTLEAELPPPPTKPPPATTTPSPDEVPIAVETDTVEEEAPADDAGGRLVVEASVLGGLFYSTIDRGQLDALFGSNYQFFSDTGGQILASCGNTTTVPGSGNCEANFAAAASGALGAQLFVAYAIHPRLHLGARAWGGAHFPDGFFVVGGPSASARAFGPLWLGATFLLGTEEHRARLTSAVGSVPPSYQAVNKAEVFIPTAELPTGNSSAGSGLLLGGALHGSLALFGPSRHAIITTSSSTKLLHGTIIAGLHPTLLKAEQGLDLMVPLSLGYRFH